MKPRSKKLNFGIFIGLLALAGLISWRILDVWHQYREIQNEARMVESEIAVHKSENQKLEENIQDLGSVQSRERMAKEDLELHRPGEVVLRLPVEETRGGAVQVDEKKENSSSWWKYLTGK